MDKFINKDGKVVLTINDDGTEKLDSAHFNDGTLIITRTSTEEDHYHEFEVTDLPNGTTTKVNGHAHKIIGKLIQPAANGHSHALPMGI